MTAAENKKLMQDAFAELTEGDSRLFVAALAEDVCWTIVGSTAWSGTYCGKDTVLGQLLRPLGAKLAHRYVLDALRFIAEDDYVVVEARGRNTTRAGLPYRNEYCWVCRVSDGKVRELTEYCDTNLIVTALGDPG